MLTITDTAVEKVREILKAEGKDAWGLRVFMGGGGCCPSYGLDIEEKSTADDEIIESNGLKVFVDKGIYSGLSGMQIDYVKENDMEGFVLKGLQAPTCSSGGCSSSTCG